jgi:hypothetical protein
MINIYNSCDFQTNTPIEVTTTTTPSAFGDGAADCQGKGF